MTVPDKTTTAPGGFGSGEVDSGYAWWRLVLTLVLGTVACVGNWSVVVLLPSCVYVKPPFALMVSDPCAGAVI